MAHALVPFVLVLFLSGIALGIAGSAMVLRLGPASEWFLWPMPALIAPFAGVYYPVSTCRAGCRRSRAAAAFLCLRRHARHRAPSRHGTLRSLAIGLALSVLYIVVAAIFFRQVYRFAVRTGLLARYSAESPS